MGRMEGLEEEERDYSRKDRGNLGGAEAGHIHC